MYEDSDLLESKQTKVRHSSIHQPHRILHLASKMEPNKLNFPRLPTDPESTIFANSDHKTEIHNNTTQHFHPIPCWRNGSGWHQPKAHSWKAYSQMDRKRIAPPPPRSCSPARPRFLG